MTYGDLARDAAEGLARGAWTAAKTFDWRGTAAGIAPGISSDGDHYDDPAVVAGYSEARREHVGDHWTDLEVLAEDGYLSGKQYITAKELREVDRFYARHPDVDVTLEDAKAGLRDAQPLDGRTVLDATGGEGWLARYLADLGADVVMGDRSRPMVDEARAKDPGRAGDYPGDVVNPRGESGSIRYYRGDVTALPLPDDAVDDGFLWRSLHHIGDLEKPLKELSRVVKPGGRAMFDTFSKRSGRRVYNTGMGMDSTLHSTDEVLDAVIDTPEMFIRGRESRFVLPYGGVRGLAAGDRHLAGNVRWNEAMEAKRPHYGSADFWTVEIDG